MRIARAELAQADAGEPRLRAFARLRLAGAGGLQSDGDVLERGLPGKQRLGLEQVAGLPVEPRQRLPKNIGAARGGRNQPGGDVEQGRFAAAGGTDDGDELAVGDRERGALDRRIAAAVGEPERDGDVGERDGGRGGCRAHACISRAASAVSQNSRNEAICPSSISIRSNRSVSTVWPVTLERILACHCTAAAWPSISMDTMV